ncbi:MAG: hypothetical protein J3K34DRAFT_527691 [Monoraphidium minutum]|nr:MAG: hypothetical protein J3K34DRAFT_527691 [Monoraphidium minutum]
MCAAVQRQRAAGLRAIWAMHSRCKQHGIADFSLRTRLFRTLAEPVLTYGAEAPMPLAAAAAPGSAPAPPPPPLAAAAAPGPAPAPPPPPLLPATGPLAGDTVVIPRLTLNTSDTEHLPFHMSRRQFPLRPAYARTINKAQGQTLTKAGLFPGVQFMRRVALAADLAFPDIFKIFKDAASTVREVIIYIENHHAT